MNAIEAAPPEGDVLAEAAVASAALSGAAVVESQHASAEAQQASVDAEAARATAAAAAATAVTEERVKALVDQGIREDRAELIAALKADQQPAAAPPVEAEVVVEAPKPDTPPESLKPKKRQTLAQRYRNEQPE